VIITLEDRLIKSGALLIRQLVSETIMIDAALWLYFPDVQKWKLLLSFPDLVRQGPKAANKTVQRVLSKIDDIAFSLDDVAISEPDAPVLNLLRTAINTSTGISGIRFSNNVINGQFIQDAYIYRLITLNPVSIKQKISA
jgi:hypothetical protein